MRQKIEVTCYAGYRGNERPTAFSHGNKTLRIIEITDRSMEESITNRQHTLRFTVKADDDKIYRLLFITDRDEWYLEG